MEITVNKSIRLTFLVLFTITCLKLNAQIPQAPFHRGVNTGGWFQANSATEISMNTYTKTDFENIATLGFDVVRLPISLHNMTVSDTDSTLHPLLFSFLDTVVDWCEASGLHLILDNHTFDVYSSTNPAIERMLIKAWTQMATYFSSSYNKLYYEILNEPHGIDDATWNQIQLNTIGAIREIDTVHTIIAGPAGWNSVFNLNAMPAYTDTNLIITFHFYEPFLFTHQGANWTDLSNVSNIPFPYRADSMPPVPAAYQGNYVENMYTEYEQEGSIEYIRSLLLDAAAFSKERNIPLYCGEFGVFDQFCQNHHRVAWYDTIQGMFDSLGISWTSWDYRGPFGLFKKGSNALFNSDLNIPLLKALQLNIPEQQAYEQIPDSAPILIYSDYVQPELYTSSYGQGKINLYSSQQPNNGSKCIHLDDFGAFTSLQFIFKEARDFRYLYENNYAIDFFVRGGPSGNNIDIMLFDTDTDAPDDRPWRMRKQLPASVTDGYWHHMHIPLSDFKLYGAYENGSWYNPPGNFEWQAVDLIQISTEKALQGVSFWFDQISITALDTALVNDTSRIEIPPLPTDTSTNNPVELALHQHNPIQIYPNPSIGIINIKSENSIISAIEIYNAQGSLMGKLCAGDYTVSVNLRNKIGKYGLYILRVHTTQGSFTCPVLYHE